MESNTFIVSENMFDIICIGQNIVRKSQVVTSGEIRQRLTDGLTRKLVLEDILSKHKINLPFVDNPFMIMINSNKSIKGRTNC